jgi:stage V sporulation protein SpoVS
MLNMASLERVAFHEAGHAVACLCFGAPIIRVTINADPHCHRGRWHSESDMALAHIAVVCLSGPASEITYVGPITDNSDDVDYAMARRYLAEDGVDPVMIGVEFERLRDAAHRLVRTDWAQQRIRLIADALLRHGTLTGDEVGVMIAADA